MRDRENVLIPQIVSSQGEMFREYTLQGRVDAAIALLREHATDAPYFGGFSGGKDSIVIKRLAEMAGVKVNWHYHVTQIDPPDLTRYIRKHHKDVTWDRVHGRTFWGDIKTKALPTRRCRWCCAIYKEAQSPKGQKGILGIRGSESPRRASSWVAAGNNRRGDFTVLPIFRWSEVEVWRFIDGENLPYCNLYVLGLKRLGCVGCPMATPRHRALEFAMYPGFKRNYERSGRQFWDAHEGIRSRFATFAHYFSWWLEDDSMPNLQCGDNPQLDLIEDVHYE
jgi:phosphoadenosine phosphosulfate reductase